MHEPSEEDRAYQYALSQLRAPSVARCRASFRRSVSHPRPTAADSVVRWTVVRRRPRVLWPPSPSLLAAQTDVPAAPSARTGITQLVVPGQGCSADRRSVTGCPAGRGLYHGRTRSAARSAHGGRGPLLRRPRVGLSRRAAGRIYPAASITSAVDRRRSPFWGAAERMDTSGEDQPT